MTRYLFFFLAFLFGLYLYISSLNPLQVKFFFYPQRAVETSLSILIMTSFFLGGLIILLVYSFKEVKRSLVDRQQRRRERELWEKFYQATEALFKGDLERAQRYLRQYLERRKDDPGAYIRLAEVYRRQGRLDEAIQVLQKAKELPRGRLEILFQEAAIYREKGENFGAIRALEEIISLSPSNEEALRQLRDIQMDEGNWDEAMKLQRRWMKVARAQKDGRRLLQGIRYERAKAMAQRGDTHEAVKELREITKEDPLFVPSQVLWGEILQEEGKGKEAVKVWEKGWERTGRMVFLERLEGYFLSQEDPRGIVHIYMEALERFPQNMALPFFYARLCLRLEMVDEALEKLREVEGFLKDHAPYQFLLAEVYQHRGEMEEAVEAYRRGVELQRWDGVSYRCSSCGEEVREWMDYCPQCSQWGTYQVCTAQRYPVSPETPGGME